MFCRNCGTSNSDSNKYCLTCGASLDSPEQDVHQDLNVCDPTTANQPNRRFISFLKKRWMIVTPAIVVIAIALICFNSIIMMFSPSYAVLRASKTTFSLLEKRMDNSPLDIFRVLSECGNNGTVGMSFSYDFGYGANLSADFSLLSKAADKDYGLLTNMSVNGKDLDLTAYFNTDRLAVKSTLVDDNFYGITYDTFANDFKIFAETADLDSSMVDSITKIFDYSRSSTDYTKVTEKFNQLLVHFFKNIKPVTTSEQISVNGENMTCRVVKYTIAEVDLDQLLDDFYTLLSSDNDVRDYILTYLEMQNIQNNVINGMMGLPSSPEDPQDLYASTLSSIEDAIDLFKDNYVGSFDISYFISGNRLVRFETSGEPNISGEKTIIALRIDFGKNPDKNDIAIDVNVSDNTSLDVNLKATFQSEYDTGVMTNMLKFKATSDAESETLTLKTEWTQETGALLLAVSAGGDDYEIDGNLTFPKGGVKLVFDDVLDDSLGVGSLDLTLTAQNDVNIPKPDFINMDQWGTSFIDKLQAAGDALQNRTN